MGFWDRFRKKKEQEVEKKISTTVEIAKKEKEAVKVVPEKTTKTKKKIPEVLAGILVRPLVTEKTAILTSGGQYVFEIDPKTNRHQVAAAVFAVYGVKPVKVGILNMRREPVRFGRCRGMQKAWKKAIVCLPKGKTINVHEGV